MIYSQIKLLLPSEENTFPIAPSSNYLRDTLKVLAARVSPTKPKSLKNFSLIPASVDSKNQRNMVAKF